MTLGNQKIPYGTDEMTAEEWNELSAEDKEEAEDIFEEEFLVEVENRMTMNYFADIIIMIVFFVFYLYWRYKSAKIAAEIEERNYTVGDYSLSISNLPQQGYEEQDLKKFFEQFGEVIEVQFARKFSGTLYSFKELSSLILKEKSEDARIQQRGDKNMKNTYTSQRITKEVYLRKYYSNFFKSYNIKSLKDFPIMGAYVVFNSLEHKVKCWKTFHEYNKPRSLLAKVFCCNTKKVMPEDHIFNGKTLIVEDAPEPMNIQWENLEFTDCERLIKKIFVFLIVVLVMVISSIMLLYTNALSKQGTILCPPNNWKNADAEMLAEVKEAGEAIDHTCFCQMQSFPQHYVLGEQASELRSFCSDYMYEKTLNLGMQASTGIVTLAINGILKSLLNKMQKWLRAKHINEEEQNIFKSIFIVLFFNITFVPFFCLTRVTLGGIDYVPTKMLTSWIPVIGDPDTGIIKQDLQYYVNDFNKEFYINVGGKYFGFFILQIFIPQIFYAFLPRVWHYIRDRKLKAPGVVTQEDAIKICTPPIFKLPQRFGEALALMFCAMMWSSGMPILLLFASCCFMTRYLADKWCCLKLYSKPSYTDSSLNTITLKWLPSIVAWHCYFAILMYSVPSIFPSSLEDLFHGDGNFLTDPNGEYNLRFRFLSPYTIFHSVIAISIIIVFLMDNIIMSVLQQYFISCFRDDPSIDVVSMDLYSKDQGDFKKEVELIKRRYLHTYDIQANDKYRDIYLAIMTVFESSSKVQGGGKKGTFVKTNQVQQ